MKNNRTELESYVPKVGDVVSTGQDHPSKDRIVEVWRDQTPIVTLRYREEEYFSVGAAALSLRVAIAEMTGADPESVRAPQRGKQ